MAGFLPPPPLLSYSALIHFPHCAAFVPAMSLSVMRITMLTAAPY